MHVIGTAGHVDHGKSALVSALTGVNPDRWLEEQLRGMTLDLGFAPLRIDGELRAGIVDVPGHERFLHNMLAGAAGMELLLLVVAANEGVREQTVDHLEILRFLNVGRTIVAVTKIDLIPQEQREATMAAIEASLRGTIAEGAPLVAVSNYTGEGLDELRARIADTLALLPPRDAQAPLYLPIDRVFTLSGLGTVVTGTIMQGSVATGDRISIAPAGLEARVRSIEVFGESQTRVDAGSRVALSIPGIDRHALSRGDVVADAAFEPRTTVNVRFVPLPHALSILTRRTPVHAYLGSAQIPGTLVLERVPEQAEEIAATLVLRSPAIAFPGARFVVRRLSPKTLLGGGYVDVTVAQEESGGSMSHAEAAAKAALRQRGREASTAEEVAQIANLRVEVARGALESLAERDEVLVLQRPAGYLDGGIASEMFDAMLERVEEVHRAEPWAMGATSIALSRASGVPETLLVRVLAEYADRGRIAHRSGYYASPAHVPALSADQQELFDHLVPVNASVPFAPAPFRDVAALVKRSPVPGATRAFETLLARGALVKVADDLYRGSQIKRIVARVEEFLRRNERMTAAEFRDLLGTSRKYAVPLLEWLDARGVTIRSGDHRTLRKGAT